MLTSNATVPTPYEILKLLKPTNLDIYKQYGYKIAIKYTNNLETSMQINCIRGNNGEIETKKVEPGKTVYIAIEPSSKNFKHYKNTKEYAGAAYPKKPEQVKSAWRPIKNSEEIFLVNEKLKQKKFIIPYYEIADFLITLNLTKEKNYNTVIKVLKQNNTSPNFGFPGKIKIFRPISITVGFKLTQTYLNKLGKSNIKSLLTSYGEVPLQKGMIINIELDALYFLKTSKFRFNKDKPTVLVYPIDAPAVKAALWGPVKIANKNEIITKLLTKLYEINK